MGRNENNIDYVEFKAHDLAKTKQFYTSCFEWRFKDHGTSYMSFSNSGLKGGFERTENNIPKGVLIVLYHANLDLIKNKIIEAGGTITKDAFAFPGGHRFHFEDPSGNELAIWSDE